MVADRSQKHSPPYVSFRTLLNLLDHMRAGVPSRIDPSYEGVAHLSGSNRTQLLAALRFLSLIDAGNVPNARLKELVREDGAGRSRLLKQFGTESYAFVLKSLDMNATFAQLTEAFQHNYSLNADVTRKCIKFFTSYAKAADIPVSKSILDKKVRATSSKGARSAKLSPVRTKPNSEIPIPLPDPSLAVSWHQSLLTKFPAFDPSWSQEFQSRWLDVYEAMIKMTPGQDSRLMP